MCISSPRATSCFVLWKLSLDSGNFKVAKWVQFLLAPLLTFHVRLRKFFLFPPQENISGPKGSHSCSTSCAGLEVAFRQGSSWCLPCPTAHLVWLERQPAAPLLPPSLLVLDSPYSPLCSFKFADWFYVINTLKCFGGVIFVVEKLKWFCY